jgi:hypothetical protein
VSDEGLLPTTREIIAEIIFVVLISDITIAFIKCVKLNYKEMQAYDFIARYYVFKPVPVTARSGLWVLVAVICGFEFRLSHRCMSSLCVLCAGRGL